MNELLRPRHEDLRPVERDDAALRADEARYSSGGDTVHYAAFGNAAN